MIVNIGTDCLMVSVHFLIMLVFAHRLHGRFDNGDFEMDCAWRHVHFHEFCESAESDM